MVKIRYNPINKGVTFIRLKSYKFTCKDTTSWHLDSGIQVFDIVIKGEHPKLRYVRSATFQFFYWSSPTQVDVSSVIPCVTHILRYETPMIGGAPDWSRHLWMLAFTVWIFLSAKF